ncbi:ENT domain-containing protein [Hirschfeldia incana]|nr:ENT domain-containing protein [Hirschfeldia incana]
MDYRPSDSSGTDDDLPPSHQNRYQRGGRPAGNGRPSAPLSRVHNDMETQIHLIEQEAYSSILRAFKAQSDAITWEKESLITELRKELRVSDEEHRELLSRVNADEMIRRIREWRKGNNNLQSSVPQMVHDNAPSPAVSGSSRKKQKTSQTMASLAMGPPSPAMHPSSMQPSSSALRRGGPPPPGPKTKKPKTFPATGISGRPTSAGEYDPLIGKKVWTRWPEDNHFYEAVITDYNPVEGLHALVYDISTPNETWEWVNLKEISPGDIRWEGEDSGVSRKGHPGQGRGSTTKAMPRGGPAGNNAGGRGRGNMKIQPHKAQNGIGKKALGDIEILHTDTLIKEIEKVFGSVNPNPAEVEKAKRVLRDHEQALVDAIAKLEELSDGESGNI